MQKSHRLTHRFKGHASRVTAPREAILEFLSRSSKHLSAKEIYASLHKSYPGMGLSTVYRTLDLLTRMGIAARLSIGGGHLICTNCEKIINYSEFMDEELHLIKKTEEKLAKKYNFTIQDHNIEFLGLCEKCK